MKRLMAVGLAVVVGLYFFLAFRLSVMFMATGTPIGIAIGVALVIMSAIGAVFLGREIWFGVQSQRLLKRLVAEGRQPEDAVELTASGRVTRASGEALFDKYRAETEANSDAWWAWLRLSLVYDAAGHRKYARSAARTAISLAKGSPATSAG